MASEHESAQILQNATRRRCHPDALPLHPILHPHTHRSPTASALRCLWSAPTTTLDREAQKVVAGKRAEAQELAAKKEAEDMAAAQAVLGAGLKGYQQRKAARDERAKLDEGAKHIQAQIRGRKERKNPASEVNVRRARNKADPQVQANDYLTQHKLLPLFEMLGQALVSEMPADPREFLIEQLEKLQGTPDASSPLNFFTEDEIDTLFAMYDVAKTGITAAQCQEALTSIGVDNVKVPSHINSFDLEAFKALIPGTSGYAS